MIDREISLSNGIKIPSLGFGTWLLPEGENCKVAVSTALRYGYRYIDTAARYGNELSVAQGISESGIPREDVFVVSKVWNTERGYKATMQAFERTIQNFQVAGGYVDLYLIHWPASPNQYKDWEEINISTWSALIELYKSGKVRAIGVSNFHEQHLRALLETEISPMVNQVEFHVGFNQDKLLDFCARNGITVIGWRPLGKGKLLDNESIVSVANKYHKSVAQICLRYCMQRGVIPIPKGTSLEHIKENIDVYDFSIDDDDMAVLQDLSSLGVSGYHPDTVDF